MKPPKLWLYCMPSQDEDIHDDPLFLLVNAESEPEARLEMAKECCGNILAEDGYFIEVEWTGNVAELLIEDNL